MKFDLAGPMSAAAAALVQQLQPWDPHWTIAVQLSVHVQARAFGFQIVNASQEDAQQGRCTPASNAVAADHLLQLLRDRAAVLQSRGKDPTSESTFQESIDWLYNAYFEQGPYKVWKEKSRMLLFEKKFKIAESHSLKVNASTGQHPVPFTGVDTGEWVRRLAELSLYFLLWTEAANLRHTPELLWLIYNIMLNSNNAIKAQALLGSPASLYSAKYWLSRGADATRQQQRPQVNGSNTANMDIDNPCSATAAGTAHAADVFQQAVLQVGFVRGALLPLRDMYGSAMMLGGLLQDMSGPYNPRWQPGTDQSGAGWGGGTAWGSFKQDSLAERQCAGLKLLMDKSHRNCTLEEVVTLDLTMFGDGCVFLDMVLQPIFNLLAEQVGLMGASKEQPALRLGYDDVNESASIAAVLHDLLNLLRNENSSRLLQEQGKDVWERLLLFFNSQAGLTIVSIKEESRRQPAKPEPYYPATQPMLKRYPRDYRRLGKLAAVLQSVLATPQQDEDRVSAGSVGASAPLVHLLPSLRVTDKLWAQLFKKTFIETRSMGAVAVAFSRLYMLHAVMLTVMSLWAYLVPEMSLPALFNRDFSILNGNFWGSNGLKVAEYASYGLLTHASLHIIKDLIIAHLLSTPKAARFQEEPAELEPVRDEPNGKQETSYRRLKGNIRLWWQRQWHTKSKKGTVVLVQPAVHPSKLLKGHNIVTLLFWVACFLLLLDSHIPSWPLNRVLARSRLLGGAGTGNPVMPVWAFVGLLYVGLWVLHRLWEGFSDLLPGGLKAFMGSLGRKHGRGAAEHFYPHGRLSHSQDWHRFLVSSLLWAVVLSVKFLFDFYVVLRPIARGPVLRLLTPLTPQQPWHVWTESILLAWSLWVAAAFLVFYDTGLFWQLLSALYSTMVLGVNRRVGHVKTWYDLVWTFPRLGHKLQQRMVPKSQSPAAQAAAVAAATVGVGHFSDGALSDEDVDTAVTLPLIEVPMCSAEEVLLAHAWDKVVDDLRCRDLLSNAETAKLKYEMLCPAPLGCTGAWLLLPRFVAAGAAVEVSNQGVTSASQIEVVCRSFNLLAWLMQQMNLITSQELQSVVMLPTKAAVAAALAVKQSKQPAAQADAANGHAADAPARVATQEDVANVAELLVSSKELLSKVLDKLQAGQGGSTKGSVDMSDIDTQLLMEEGLKGLMIACPAARLPYTTPDALARAVARSHTDVFSHQQLAVKAIRWLLEMLNLTRGEAAPVLPEVGRVLCFFATSLNNPKMPTAAAVACSRSMTTLTPHYGEEVMYAYTSDAALKEMAVQNLKLGDGSGCLVKPSGDPTETLKYLSVVYKLEWANFVERLLSSPAIQDHIVKVQQQKLPAAPDVTHDSFAKGAVLHPWLHELLSWASMRGQLLLRTVHGMMYYETALQQLVLMQHRTELLAGAHLAATSAGVQLREKDTWVNTVVNEAALMLARQKYTYVVSSQALGEFQLAADVPKRWLGYCIRAVVAKRYPSLRIAYIDLENLGNPPKPAAGSPSGIPEETEAAVANSGGRFGRKDCSTRNRLKNPGPMLMRQYSVLLQWSEDAQCVQELYRVRLPMNLETDTGIILGEGKPENQNHAVIFCHAETLQTIDCNQDGYLVEALKLPNLLAEFGELAGDSGRDPGRSRWWRRRVQPGPALVGFREWIFSEDSGALAEFAAATERSFGTTVQRVMHNPGACRFHYGHPDVWDKLFTMTNGGVSKANKGLHVSEDVFGGYNVMLRGRDITYVDYISVGKGRDMGFETINTFECKIAAGNGEQVIARDVHRLARRLNTPRLLTWYHTGNGFFINSSLLMFSLLVNAWLCLLLALSSVTPVGSTVLADALALLGGLQLLQLGSLSLLVYVATVWLEDGFMVTLKNVLKQLVSGSLLFYVFRGQTTAQAFTCDVKFGGAKYEATGRGYKLQATPFMDLFQQYGRSHMWYGAHILWLIVVALCVGLPFSVLGMWSYALVVMALLMAPFWFNPFTFSWDVNKAAAREFMAWMAGHRPAGKHKKLWRDYNAEQLRQLADDDRVQLGRTSGHITGLVHLLPIAVIIGFAVAGMLDAWWKSVCVVVAVNVLLYLTVTCWSVATRLEAVRNAAVTSRLVKFIIKLLLLVAVVVLLVAVLILRQHWLFYVVMRVLYIEFEAARLLCRLLLAFLPHYQPARRLVNRVCWLADLIVGLEVLLFLFIGSLFGLLTRYQAAVLFSFGYAAAYLAERDLEGSELGKVAKELRDMQRQQRAAAQQSHDGAAHGPQAANSSAAPRSSSAAATTAAKTIFSKEKSASFIMAAAGQALAAAEGIAAAVAATAAEAGSSNAAETAGSAHGARGERFCTVTRNAAATPDRDVSPPPGHAPVAHSSKSSPARVSCPADLVMEAALPNSPDTASAGAHLSRREASGLAGRRGSEPGSPTQKGSMTGWLKKGASAKYNELQHRLESSRQSAAEHPDDSDSGEWEEDVVGKQASEAETSGEIKPEAPGAGTWDD